MEPGTFQYALAEFIDKSGLSMEGIVRILRAECPALGVSSVTEWMNPNPSVFPSAKRQQDYLILLESLYDE